MKKPKCPTCNRAMINTYWRRRNDEPYKRTGDYKCPHCEGGE